MKIGLVVENLDARRGGVEQWTCQFARCLLGRNHEVHVVAKQFGPSPPAGIVPHAVGATRSRCDFAAAAERILRGLTLDVIHDMGVGRYCDIFQPHGGSRHAAFQRNLALAPRWQRPVKRCLAGALPRYRDFDRLVAGQYVNDGRVFMALSRMVADHFRTLHDVPDERIRLVYNGVDTQRYSPHRHQQFREQTRAALGLTDEVLLLIVAHNFRLKGVPTLLRAVTRLARDGANVRLAVVGGKPRAAGGLLRRAKAARLCATGSASAPHRQSGLSDSGTGRASGTHSIARSTPRRHAGMDDLVHYVGPVEDATPYYAAADVYVHPTYYDPCSLVVLESLASGLPVVTSRFNGAGELITPGVEGHVVSDPSDSRELADSLLPLLDAPCRASMGRAARRLAEQHTIEHNCLQVLEVYHEIDPTARLAA